MKTINFRQFAMFTDITKKNSVRADVSREFADAIYRGANGIVAHSVAMRIYESSGEMVLSAEEELFLREYIKGNTTPLFQDSFEANLKEKE